MSWNELAEQNAVYAQVIMEKDKRIEELNKEVFELKRKLKLWDKTYRP